MPHSPVYCIDCEHWHTDNKSLPSYRHMCAKWPNPDSAGFGFVTRDRWDKDDPFRKCSELNKHGICPLYRERRDKQMEMV